MYSFTERRRQEDVPGGDTVLYDVDDITNYRLPTCGKPFEEHNFIYSHLQDVELRDDDVFLNSYPKTGRQTKTPEAIFVLRNPKDVAVSFYNHTTNLLIYEYEGKFENYLQMFMRGETDFGSYPKYLLEWQQFIRENPDWPVHVVYYENIKTDCLREIKELCKFLEQDVSDNYIADVIRKCDFKRMKQTKVMLFTPKQQEISKKIYKTGFSNTMRKGEIGDWKNWFTVAQNEMFDAWWAEQAKDLGMFSYA